MTCGRALLAWCPRSRAAVRQVERQYQAIVLGVPKRPQGVVETNIGRDVRNRKSMGTFPFMSSRCRLPAAPLSFACLAPVRYFLRERLSVGAPAAGAATPSAGTA